jgi:hypothetical protein
MKNRITRNLAEREKAATNSIAALPDAVTSTNSPADPK